jgi:hypothetical protein
MVREEAPLWRSLVFFCGFGLGMGGFVSSHLSRGWCARRRWGTQFLGRAEKSETGLGVCGEVVDAGAGERGLVLEGGDGEGWSGVICVGEGLANGGQEELGGAGDAAA